jgi:hypothetical protein
MLEECPAARPQDHGSRGGWQQLREPQGQWQLRAGGVEVGGPERQAHVQPPLVERRREPRERLVVALVGAARVRWPPT